MTNSTLKPRPKGFKIIVNGKEHTVEQEEVSYEYLVKLVLGDIPDPKTATITVTFEKALGGKPDGLLQPGESVKITNGTIFTVSEAKNSWTIIVNTREVEVDNNVLSFEKLVELAYGEEGVESLSNPDVVFVITYRDAADGKQKGNLTKGQSITIQERTVFNVKRTNRS